MTTEATMGESAHAAPHWLDAEEQRAWRAFIFSSNTLLGNLSTALERAPGIDLTLAEYEILVRLSEAPDGSLRMSELAEQVVHSRSRLTHTVSRLENRGLVQRLRCTKDGRGREAVMTEEGRTLLEKAAPVHVQSVRDLILDVLGRERFLALGDLMAELVPEGIALGDPAVVHPATARSEEPAHTED